MRLVRNDKNKGEGNRERELGIRKNRYDREGKHQMETSGIETHNSVTIPTQQPAVLMFALVFQDSGWNVDPFASMTRQGPATPVNQGEEGWQPRDRPSSMKRPREDEHPGPIHLTQCKAYLER
jgi:hypothetical protein